MQLDFWESKQHPTALGTFEFRELVKQRIYLGVANASGAEPRFALRGGQQSNATIDSTALQIFRDLSNKSDRKKEHLKQSPTLKGVLLRSNMELEWIRMVFAKWCKCCPALCVVAWDMYCRACCLEAEVHVEWLMLKTWRTLRILDSLKNVEYVMQVQDGPSTFSIISHNYNSFAAVRMTGALPSQWDRA